MRKIVLALAALAAVGLALPAVTAPAEARDVVIIKKKPRHYGWYRGHHYGWNKHRHHRDNRVRVIVR
jgi:Spy/CpxP family protein refolding chaperone